MLQKQSKVTVSDGSGVSWLQVFHIYRGSWRRYANIGDFVKTSVREVVGYPRYVRGKRYKPLRVGYIVRGLVTNTVAWSRFKDNTRFRFYMNSIVLLKKRGTFRSKYIYTPISRMVRKRQYRVLFYYVF